MKLSIRCVDCVYQQLESLPDTSLSFTNCLWLETICKTLFPSLCGNKTKSTNKQDNDRNSPNRLFAASHSGGTIPPCWRAGDALRQDKQRALNKFLYLSCPSASPFSPAWWFCTTWMTSCKGPILWWGITCSLMSSYKVFFKWIDQAF